MSRYDIKTWGGSGGSLAGDAYRENKGQAAANALDATGYVITTSSDHLNTNELCTEVITRLANTAKKSTDAGSHAKAVTAINNLRAGFGYGKKQSDHSSNNCIDVLGSATN